MSGPELFAGLFVGDYEASRAWYGRLLGAEPAFLASDTEAVWQLGEQRWLYIKQHPEHAGHGEVTLFPEDLDATVAGAAGRGVDPQRHEDYPGGVRKVVYRDPDGNEIGFGGATA
ncbi:VOC family protein [Actinomycetospora flava]|uniref:VOC family protein n=1 Tax=Actinomycetospora flava TaxID=3129232 RepID=A0ABU8M8N9_9PSEU